MLPKIKKILFPTDISENSAYAFRYAMNSAKRNDAHIVILHVIEKMPLYVLHQLESHLDAAHRKVIINDNIAYTRDRIKKQLKAFCDRELKNDPDCARRVTSIEISEGFPAEEILKKADELNCDLIIMGTHGKGGLSHTFLGSVAQRVLRRTKKPVYIIPMPEDMEES